MANRAARLKIRRFSLPEDGTGWGYQLEGVLSYQVTEQLYDRWLAAYARSACSAVVVVEIPAQCLAKIRE